MSQTTLDKILSQIKKLDVDEIARLKDSVSSTQQAKGGRKERDNLYQRGKRWYYRFRHEGNEYRGSGGTSKEVAREKMMRLKRILERGERGLPKKSTLTLKDFTPAYLEWVESRGRSMGRYYTSLKRLNDAMGLVRLVDIDRVRVEAYMRERQKHVSNPTINREIACLRALLNRALTDGEILFNPIAHADIMFDESPSRSPVLGEDDETKLKEESPEWLKYMIQLAILTACRRGELLALRWKNVNLDPGSIAIEDSKSGKSRVIPIENDEILSKWRSRLDRKPEGFVVTLPDGRPPEKDYVSHAFMRATRKCGRPDLRFHDLRHIAVERFHNAGMTLDEICAITGHSTLNMARKYLRFDVERVRGNFKKVRVVKIG